MSKRRCQPERELQKAVCAELESRGLFFTSTAGGVAYKPHQLALLLRTGYRRGIPDLMILEPSADFHGLFIELKAPRRYPKPHQTECHAELRARGYEVYVCYSVSEVAAAVDAYFLRAEGKQVKRLRSEQEEE